MTAAGGRAHRLDPCGCWASPAGWKVMTVVAGWASVAGGQERVSATTFSTPGTRHILYVSCVFSYITELPLLPQHPGIGAAAEGIGEGAMICPQLKLPALYLETEVSNGAESCQQLPVERAIGHLSAVQLFGKEPQRLPRVAAAAALMICCFKVT